VRTMLLALTGYLLILSGPRACAGPAGTSEYVFVGPQSTFLQTGGIAGVHWTYHVEGRFRLTVNLDTHTASFSRVDATATDDSPYQRTLDPNEVFSLTGLTGMVVDETTIRFEGEAADGSSVVITLTFADGTVTLKGETTPPPNSADFFLFTLDAVAQRQDAYPVKTTEQLVFVGPESTILQTGGFAGVHWTYHIEGRFRLTVDADTHTASFSRVEANAVDDSPYKRTLDPNEVFNLTGLAGTVADDGKSIRFEGKAHDGSSVLIVLTFADGSVALKGETTPPPHSADFFVFTLDAVARRKYAGGSGEPNDPYQIATADDLITLSEDPNDYSKHFKLMADIDLSGFDGKDGRPTFHVIGDSYTWTNGIDTFLRGTPFAGVFDGNGNTISHLTALKANGNLLGLFGGVERRGQVKNLRVVADVNIGPTEDIVGALAGYNEGTVAQCSSEGGILGERSTAIGGLVGVNLGGTITDCHSTAVVAGGLYGGGLVGCNSHRNTSGNRRRGLVSQCFSAGRVSGDPYLYIGGLVGRNDGDVVDSFWDTETSDQAASAGGTGKTTAEMQKAKTFLDAGWDFVGETKNGTEDIWWILEGQDYPRLVWERVLSDDFQDGQAEPLWMLYQPEPELVWLKEVDGRLEVEAVAQMEDVDAIYAAQGWRLDATQDFALRVDFHFSKCGTGDGRVTLGVIPSLDPAGMQWAELEAGSFGDMGPLYLYEVRDRSWVQERTTSRFANDGTLYLSYHPDVDELYFSYTGYGKANAWQTVSGLLKGRWASEAVYVILSGGSEGMALSAGDAWLDNFVLDSGALAPNTSAQE